MKHSRQNIKSFNEFNQVNEELTRNQRLYLNIPRFLGAFLTRELLNQYPMLNFRWRELKKSTKKSGYDPLFSSPSVETLNDNIKKITKNDLPKNRLGLGMFLRDWNVYLSDRKSKGGAGDPNAVERPVVYISKDEMKVGDKYAGYRINDNDIYPDFKIQYIVNDLRSRKDNGKKKQIKPNNLEEYPIIVIMAKFDQTEKVDNIKQYIDDIFLELEDDLPVEINPNPNAHGDIINIPINIINKRKELNYSDELLSRLEEVAERVKRYLNTEGYDFDYSIDLAVVGPFYYFGNKGRFDFQLKEVAKKYSERWHRDRDSGDRIWIRRETYYGSETQRECFNISGFWGTNNDDLKIHPDDIRTLISDLDNCYKNYKQTTVATGVRVNDEKSKIKIKDIKFRAISIRFFKQKHS